MRLEFVKQDGEVCELNIREVSTFSMARCSWKLLQHCVLFKIDDLSGAHAVDRCICFVCFLGRYLFLDGNSMEHTWILTDYSQTFRKHLRKL